MTPPIPNLLPVDGHEILESRHKKHIKLEYNREKSLAEQNRENKDNS